MTKLEAIVYCDTFIPSEDFEQAKIAMQIITESVVKLEKISGIITTYKNGTDVWSGMDDAYVIDKIDEVLND